MKNGTTLLSLILTVFTQPALAESLCITHAGDAERELENSMASLRSSLARGSDGMEIDLQHTKDKVAILSHDDTLKKVGRSKEGKSCPLDADISTMRLDFIRENCELTNGENIPTLQEVLEAYSDKNIHLLLDIKDRPSRQTIKMVNEYSQIAPIRIVALVKLASDLLPPLFLKHRFKVPCLLTNNSFVPVLSGLYDGIDVANIKDHQIERLLKHDKLISLYNVNDEASLERAFRLNISLITTDNLDECLKQK